MNNVAILEPEGFYHIYNRAVGSEKLFLSEFDYGQFLYKWQKYISPISVVYSYCLMPNHFHFLVQIKPLREISKTLEIKEKGIGKTLSQRFSNFYNSYAKSFNMRNARKGKLFMLPFKRKHVDTDGYYTQLVYYIHRNPLHHGLLIEPGKYEYSSYGDILRDTPTFVYRNAVLSWFGGRNEFIQYHQYMNLFPD